MENVAKTEFYQFLLLMPDKILIVSLILSNMTVILLKSPQFLNQSFLIIHISTASQEGRCFLHFQRLFVFEKVLFPLIIVESNMEMQLNI